MTTRVSCHECGRVYRVPPEMAGKRVRCKVCGAGIPIPAAEPTGDDFALLAALADGDEAPADPAPAVAPAIPRHRAARAAVARPTPARPTPAAVADAYVRFPGDTAVGRYTVVASLGLYGLTIGLIVFRAVALLNEAADARHASAYVRGRVAGEMAGTFFKGFVVVPAIVTGVCWLAVWAASKAAKFRLEPGSVLKAAAVVVAPVAAHGAMNGFTLTEDVGLLPPWWLAALACPVVLWATLRLRAVPYLVTVAFVLAACVGPPVALRAFVEHTRQQTFGPPPSAAQPPPPFGEPTRRPAFAAGNSADDDADHLRTVYEQVVAWAQGEGQGRAPYSLDQLVSAGKLQRSDVGSPTGGPRFVFMGAAAPFPFADDAILAQAIRSRSGGSQLFLFGDGRVELVPPSQIGEVMRRAAMAHR